MQVRRQIFVVVDTGHSLLGSKGMGEDTGIHVDTFLWGDTHKEVCMLHTCFLQCLKTGGQGLIGHHVILAQPSQSFTVSVDEHTVLMLAR